MFIGQKVSYKMVHIAYPTELNLQICNQTRVEPLVPFPHPVLPVFLLSLYQSLPACQNNPILAQDCPQFCPQKETFAQIIGNTPRHL